MARETVPADIAGFVKAFGDAEQALGRHQPHEGNLMLASRLATRDKMRAALDAAILHHLRAADEMKAALERIEQGA